MSSSLIPEVMNWAKPPSPSGTPMAAYWASTSPRAACARRCSIGSIVASAAMASTASFIARRAALCCSISASRIRAGSVMVEQRVQLGGGALPRELRGPAPALGTEGSVPDRLEDLVGDVFWVARVGVAGAVAAGLGEGAGAGGDDGCAAGHRLDA